MRNANKFGLLPQLALVCLLLFGIVRCSLGYSAHGEESSPHSYRNGTRFLFADLDGDRIPDLAQVELQNQRSAKTNYSIHVKLSAGMEWAIGISGPDGGLRVAARDVNGDDALDLIVTSNLDASFVEVLLNDGHGNFSVAKAEEFVLPETGGAALNCPDGVPADRFSLAVSRLSSDLGTVEQEHCAPLLLSRGFSTIAPQAVLYGSAVRHGGRAPPASIAAS